LNRALTLLEKNNESRVPAVEAPALVPDAAAREFLSVVGGCYESLAFHEALQKVQELVTRGNQFVNEKEPWKAVKTDLPGALKTLGEVVRLLKLAALALHPVMPVNTAEIWKQLGESTPIPAAARRTLADGGLSSAPDAKVSKGSPLFPRKEVPPAVPG
jgi:methionyl-tRNA synthetase